MIKSINLTKKFDDLIAVNNFNPDIDKTGIFGLIGPDGAGKTTLIRLMYGIMDPTGGDTIIENISVRKNPAFCHNRFYRGSPGYSRILQLV